MTSQDTYPLPRTSSEADRLDAQSRIWTTNLDYQLHPSIIGNLPAHARIADIGTGTSTFLADLTRALPSTCSYDGFDISSTQFRTDLPSNVRLHVQDALSDYPDELHGQFDVVHLRILVAGLEQTDWEVATRNALTLLKPDGAIQWEEADFEHAQHLRAGGAGTSVEVFRMMIERMQKALAGKFRWCYNILPSIFKDMRLTSVVTDRVASDRVADTRREMAVTSAAGVVGWARKNKVWDRAYLDQLEGRIWKEVKDGAYSRYDIWVAVGFKPKPG